MMWRLEMTREFLEQLQFFTKNDKRIASKIMELMLHCQRDPFQGLGKPEPLKHQLTGLWSRRIDQEHRLVYEIDEVNQLVVCMSCHGHYE